MRAMAKYLESPTFFKVCLFVCLFIYLFICLFVQLFNCLFEFGGNASSPKRPKALCVGPQCGSPLDQHARWTRIRLSTH